MVKKAVVVLSGGQDSTLCLDIACKNYGADKVHAVTFDYDQRHRREIEAARDVALLYGVDHEIIVLGPVLSGVSPLTNKNETLETYPDYESMDAIIGDRVEKTFVPMRNALFLTIAANRAACLGAAYLYTGVCQADNANYPDCRQDFIASQQNTINTALGFSVGSLPWISICAPLMNMTKAESVQYFFRNGNFAALALTHTAYDGNYPPVSKDHASVLRAQGFLEAGVPDPLVVRACMEGFMPLPDTANYIGFANRWGVAWWANTLCEDINEVVITVGQKRAGL